MEGLIIRLASTDDAATVAAIHVHAWRWAYRGQLPDSFLDGLPATLEQRAARWQQILRNQSDLEQTWLAELNGAPVGFVSIGPGRDDDATPATGEVYAIYLEEHAAGRGIGRALFAHTVALLQEHGFTTDILWVLASNKRARRFYEAAGWHADGVKQRGQEGAFEGLGELRYRKVL